MGGSFIEPRYADHALVNVLGSVQARLTGAHPVLQLPHASRYVVLLVDGLGWHQLAAFADGAPLSSGEH